MKCRECLSEMIKTCDLFSLTQFLRYDKDEDYKTISGGLISLVVGTIFCVLFAGNALNTINKTDISWTLMEENDFDPTRTTLTFNEENKFMFTIGMPNINLNDASQRYFDIEIVELYLNNGNFQEINIIQLVPCTLKHFERSQNIMDNFESISAWRRLCPPLNYSYDIMGKFTSREMKQIEVRLSKCNDTLDPLRPCVNQSVIDGMITALGGLTVGMFFVNPLINAGNKDYLSYYF